MKKLRKSIAVLLIVMMAALTGGVLTGCGEPLTLEAYSIDGRKVYTDRVDGETSIDVSRWAKGVYVLRAGSRTEKLIVR